MTYRVLLIPPQDYIRHPHLTRLHHIFENFDDTFQLTILNVRLRGNAHERESKHEIVEVGRPRRSMLFSYLLAYGEFHRQIARMIKQRRIDAVVLSHVISPVIPFLLGRVPLVFDYKDVYSASASAPFRQPLRFFVYWISRLFEGILFKCPMTMVVPTPSMKALLQQKFGVSSVLITNGVNMRIFKPISRKNRMAVRNTLGLREDDLVLCYLGSIENWLDLETVVAAVEAVKDAKLILIGGSVRSPDYFNHILSMCVKKGLASRVTATGFLTQSKAAPILSAADAAIIPFRTDLSLSRIALPDKLFEYLATGIPVISTRLPDIASMFGNIVHFYDDPEGLIRILRQLLAERGSRGSNRRNAILIQEYDWKTISDRYQELLRRLIKRQRAN